MTRPDLRIVPPADYDTRPNLLEAFGAANGADRRPSYFAEVAADWRDIISEVRASPYSHGLVALAAIVGWTAVLVAPLLIGGRS